MTALVTVTNAEALTIGSRIANEEAALRLANAEYNLANLDLQDEILQGDIETFKVYEKLGDTGAPANIARAQARIDENNRFREEQKKAIEDINIAKQQSSAAAAIAGLLATGNPDEIQKVINDAPDAIKEFKELADAAEAIVTELDGKVELTSSKLESLTSGDKELNDNQTNQLNQLNTDL